MEKSLKQLILEEDRAVEELNVAESKLEDVRHFRSNFDELRFIEITTSLGVGVAKMKLSSARYALKKYFEKLEEEK